MNIHYLQHAAFEGIGSIQTWANAERHRVTATKFYDNDILPSLDDFDGLIVMGGPMNVYEEDKYPWLVKEKLFIEDTIAAGKTVIGICLGAQLIANVLGAKVYTGQYKEIGWFKIHKTKKALESHILNVFPSELEVFHWHGDTFDLPSGAIHVARSTACENQAFIYNERIIALQFHLETTRETAEQLICHCSEEIIDAPYIQSAGTMLSDNQRFTKINMVMEGLLNELW